MYQDIIYINDSNSTEIFHVVAKSLDIEYNENMLKNDDWEIYITENDDWYEIEGIAGYRWVLEIDCNLGKGEYVKYMHAIFNEINKLTEYVAVDWEFENEFPELSIGRELPVINHSHISYIFICILILLSACTIMVGVTWLIMEIVKLFI